jgi:hypothetical protein
VHHASMCVNEADKSTNKQHINCVCVYVFLDDLHIFHRLVSSCFKCLQTFSSIHVVCRTSIEYAIETLFPRIFF